MTCANNDLHWSLKAARAFFWGVVATAAFVAAISAIAIIADWWNPGPHQPVDSKPPLIMQIIFGGGMAIGVPTMIGFWLTRAGSAPPVCAIKIDNLERRIKDKLWLDYVIANPNWEDDHEQGG